MEFVVTDDHAGLKRAVSEVLPEAAWQRCYVHFLRNALDHLPRKADDDCLQELRWIYDRRDLEEAQADLAAWLSTGRALPQAVRLGRGAHRGDADLLPAAAPAPQAPEVHQHAGAAERGDQAADPRGADLPQRGQLPAAGAGPGVETHENWLEDHRYLNMDLLKEHKKEAMKIAA